MVLGLKLIELIENKSITETVNIVGTSYFFNNKTIHKMGFEVLNPSFFYRLNLFVNFIDLIWMYSLSQGKFSIPRLWDAKKASISGAKLIESKKVIEFLINLNTELEGTPFKIAYRVRDEFLIYCYYSSLNKTNSNWLTNALDEMTSMKILSRIEGDETKTGSVLSNLQRVLTADYKKSNTKLKEMETRLSTSGYTSFWS
jgi:hypothetical protein